MFTVLHADHVGRPCMPAFPGGIRVETTFALRRTECTRDGGYSALADDQPSPPGGRHLELGPRFNAARLMHRPAGRNPPTPPTREVETGITHRIKIPQIAWSYRKIHVGLVGVM
jgi:hypothetical protein